MRSTWKGTISVGLLCVPVKAYGAVDDHPSLFNNLHSECKSRLKMPKYCPVCERQVEAGEVVKGYPVGKEYVVITDEDLDTLPLAASKSITIEGFIKSRPDPRFFDKPYFLAPEEAGTRAFLLLMKGMEDEGLTAIAKIAMRDKEHLVAIRAFGGVLLMQTLHWGDEIRDYKEIAVEGTISDKELFLAKSLLKGMTQNDLDIYSYRDEYRDAVTNLVSAKLEGRVLEPVAAKTASSVDDLMAQLEASLAAIEAK